MAGYEGDRLDPEYGTQYGVRACIGGETVAGGMMRRSGRGATMLSNEGCGSANTGGWIEQQIGCESISSLNDPSLSSCIDSRPNKVPNEGSSCSSNPSIERSTKGHDWT